jgi:hypothetical protein
MNHKLDHRKDPFAALIIVDYIYISILIIKPRGWWDSRIVIMVMLMVVVTLMMNN